MEEGINESKSVLSNLREALMQPRSGDIISLESNNFSHL
jgi:hypothetical protein